MVVGEFERAFAAGQFDDVANLLAAHGVGVWLPEAGGPVEVGSVMHRALMTLLGAQSQREVVRARQRTMTAMRRQVVEQGRYLGGRAPYGYKLVDAGPHPNRVHARWGRRLRKFAPDPTTARNVRWMFAQRVAGRSAASIARELTGRRVQTPSGRHGAAGEWSERTVIEILRNPRYTGRQVWNRTSTDRSQRAAGADRFAQDRNGMGKWVVSAVVAHPALVSEEDFVAAQSARVVRTGVDGNVHIYRYVGLLQCGECGRRMDAHRVHGRPGYRCRHGHRSSRTRPADAPSNLYRREDQLTVAIVDRLSRQGCRIGGDLDEIEAFLRARRAIVICHRDEVNISLRRCGRRVAATNLTAGCGRRRGRRHNPRAESKPHGQVPS
ncbi:recombinase family protein [Kibdelosporangium phytohabitans]|uniref:recombinase family protein n=1 Tax=Kibdelosporangium phytohabitans TaxID=860235 RepID=UPI001A0D816E|nr:DNA invertase Pin-like site-specific DNA recombinase [Kibdelosporangium phytohabitans]